MPQTARLSAKTTLNVTSGHTMLRRDMSTGATALSTLIAERRLTTNVLMREHMNAHHNLHSFSNLLVKKMNQDQDQGRNATVSLVVTLPILMNVMMGPPQMILLVLMNSTPDGSATKKRT